jgi:sulfur relay (sulfurtransferase) complex TusBCD TusD component (DsrE family)
MEARGLSEDSIIEGCEQSGMDELAQLSLDAKKVFTF